jgi:hypothetical protein
MYSDPADTAVISMPSVALGSLKQVVISAKPDTEAANISMPTIVSGSLNSI